MSESRNAGLGKLFWIQFIVIGIVCLAVRPVYADQVINDDLIVVGSIGVGQDSTNGQNFGFDTIILKENNLRILFDDTSSTASFPDNDWRLTANDSANGGQEKFSIDDASAGRSVFTVEAGARANALYVRSNGNIGIGTSTPVVNLHVVTGNTPTLRLEQDGSSGFTAQTWDVAGNEANFFIRDVTAGSRLVFRIQPNAPTNSIFVNNAGNVALGTATAQGKFHVENTAGNDTDDFVVTSNGNVGVGTVGPLHKLTIGTGTQNIAFEGAVNVPFAGFGYDSTLDGGNGGLAFRTNIGAGDFNTVPMVLLRVSGNVGIGTTTPAGKLDVNGTIFQRGVSIHPDFVFEQGYELESIEDHAAYMWKNKHLRAVGAGQNDDEGRAIIDLGSQTLGMLEELEKAHIYIEQLHTRLADAAKQNAKLEERLARVEAQVVADRNDE